MPEESASEIALTPGAERILEEERELQQGLKHSQPGTNHWLVVLLDRHAEMAEALAKNLEAKTLAPYLREQLRQGTVGTPLDESALVKQAKSHAQARGVKRAAETDLAAVILSNAGYSLIGDSSSPSPSLGEPPPQPSGSGWQPIARRPTPTLEKFGRDLTGAALAGKLTPLVGRDEEIQLIEETLCRRTKRNPLLVGPAGVGKTAIVEGFAQRVVQGAVPQILRGMRVFATHSSLMTAGASMVGELQQRMQALLTEASQDGIILFIDELHTVIGAGGAPGTNDIASLLKPALARGDFACIGATTDEEFRRYVEPDAALERRFQPMRIQELTPYQTLQILTVLRDQIARQRGVQVADPILNWLVSFAEQYMRNRHFPDKGVDLLEQCVAFALVQGKNTVEMPEAENVAHRMAGMPGSVQDRVSKLESCLTERAILSEEDTRSLVNRLQVTERGLDMHPLRPNAVVLLVDSAAELSDRLATTVSECFMGDRDRIVTIDFTRFTQPADITLLLGAPPGYVGYDDTLPIHRISQIPWCVLCCECIHLCHPSILQVLARALGDGYFKDAHGKSIYLSDTVVLLTAQIGLETQREVGFSNVMGDQHVRDAHAAAGAILGQELVARCDLICAQTPKLEAALRQELQNLLTDLSVRYRKEGVLLRWEDRFIDDLANQKSLAGTTDWERYLDGKLAPILIPLLATAREKEVHLHLVGGDKEPIRIEKDD